MKLVCFCWTCFFLCNTHMVCSRIVLNRILSPVTCTYLLIPVVLEKNVFSEKCTGCASAWIIYAMSGLSEHMWRIVTGGQTVLMEVFFHSLNGVVFSVIFGCSYHCILMKLFTNWSCVYRRRSFLVKDQRCSSCEVGEHGDVQQWGVVCSSWSLLCSSILTILPS
jgi:hypothetical protein